jgi:hypothetical protein
MPHAVLTGRADLEAAWHGLPSGPWRWERAVARIEGCYLARESRNLLVTAVVVEYGRALHAVVLVSHRGADTVVSLWPVVGVERTDGVKRVVAQVARELGSFGCGPVVTTNLGELRGPDS